MPTPYRTTEGGVLRVLFSSARSYPMGGLSTDSQIARALHHAQLDSGRSAATRPMSLEEIVAVAQENSGWNHAFKWLKEQGLLEEQTLGQVVARWNNRYGRAGASAELEAALRNGSLHAPSQTGL